MEFVFERSSPLPPSTQIKEQIKVALLLGNLRPGEILPSIRDLEKELGISRNIVRRAYVELEELGLLKLIQGKGVMVSKNLKYKEDKEFKDKCAALLEVTHRECQQIGVIFSSFARFLYQKALEMEQAVAPVIYVDISPEVAKERADDLSRILHINVRSMSVSELRQVREELDPNAKVTCNYYRFDEVKPLVMERNRPVIPFRMRFGEKTVQEIEALPKGSKVMFVFEKHDQSGLSLILEEYRRTFAHRNLEFDSQSVDHLEELVGDPSVAKFIISNRIWKTLDPKWLHRKGMTHPYMEFDLSSIEESKLELGIVV